MKEALSQSNQFNITVPFVSVYVSLLLLDPLSRKKKKVSISFRRLSIS